MQNVSRLMWTCLIGVAVASCERTDVSADLAKLETGAALVGPFHSLMTPTEVARALNRPEAARKVTREFAPNDPQHDLVKESNLELPDAGLLGVSGRVRLDFFADRLGVVVFFPEDQSKVLDLLGVGPLHQGEIQASSPVRINVSGGAIVWYDERVMNAVGKHASS